MQIGPSLHRLPGVRHMASEDSGAASVHPPVAATSVHGECRRFRGAEAVRSEMDSCRHRPHDPGEGYEVLLLRAHERLRFEEGNDSCQEVIPVPDYVHQRGVACAGVICTNPPTAEPMSDQVEDLASLRSLADVELGGTSW